MIDDIELTAEELRIIMLALFYYQGESEDKASYLHDKLTSSGLARFSAEIKGTLALGAVK